MAKMSRIKTLEPIVAIVIHAIVVKRTVRLIISPLAKFHASFFAKLCAAVFKARRSGVPHLRENRSPAARLVFIKRQGRR